MIIKVKEDKVKYKVKVKDHKDTKVNTNSNIPCRTLPYSKLGQGYL
jgi:hypothetical protein